MIKKLESTKDYVLAIEIANEYVNADVEQCKQWFDEKLAQGKDKVNLICKVDELPVTHISCRAFWEDGLFALRHIKNLGHIAIIGHGKLLKIMVGMDGAMFNRSKKGLVERYFDVSEMDKAWDFVNEEV